MRPILIISITLTALVGCATTQTTPTYVDPALYAKRDCDTLALEIGRISELAKKSKHNPLTTTGVGFGITGGRGGIYPTISFGVGKSNSNNQQQLAELYGKHDAMVIAARHSGCTFAQNIKTYSET